MTRRRFVIWLAAVAVLAAEGGRALWLKLQPATALIAAALRRHLGDLVVSPADVRRFAADHARYISPKERFALGVLAPLAPVYVHVETLAKAFAGERLRRFEEAVVTNFLLGTDFFASGADESRPIRYLGYPDPYVRPCGNPLARVH
jgi:hypothetical protein